MNKNTLYELLKEDRTVQQWRSIWTTYCLANDLLPDTKEYDDLLYELYQNFWNKGGWLYESYVNTMSEDLC